MPVDPPAYPVNLLVAGRPVLVVGGGAVALEKVRGLLAAEAVVTVVAPEVLDELAALAVRVERRPYVRGEVASYRLAVAATDDPERCSYTLPARLDRGRLLVTVSTSGRSPAVTSWLRDQLAEVIGPEHEILLEMVAERRAALQAAGALPPAGSWRTALESGMLELIRDGRTDEARALLDSVVGPPPAEPGT